MSDTSATLRPPDYLPGAYVLARKGDEHHLALGWKVNPDGVSVISCIPSNVGHSDKRFCLSDNPLVGVTLIGVERFFDQPGIIGFTAEGISQFNIESDVSHVCLVVCLY